MSKRRVVREGYLTKSPPPDKLMAVSVGVQTCLLVSRMLFGMFRCTGMLLRDDYPRLSRCQPPRVCERRESVCVRAVSRPT